ncbi:acyltransferase [Streptomyces sp. YIM 98790]|uniref:acyltransferase family protein n=1 Tax=Streptomyces sp. YIM 98790 TaxID=2689077 RepID=UPI00140A7339|nr:acyltransferase [Streptomyces sp. YIM 98790]
MSSTTPPLHLSSLTGLRFLAAFAVFFSHVYYVFWYVEEPGPTFTRAVLVAASAGVSFFFVLSGFVLTWSARPEDTAGAFWRRRFVKIYPNHVVAWAAALGLMVSAGTLVSAGQALPNLFLIQSWLPDHNHDAAANGVSWSLSCEIFFYACFPLLMVLAQRLSTRQITAAVVVTAVGIWMIPTLAFALLPDSPSFPEISATLHQHWFVYAFPVARLLEFVLGMLLATLVRRGRLGSVRPWHAGVLLCLGAPVAVEVTFLRGLVSVLAVPLAVLVVAFANRDIRGGGSVLGRRGTVWLGTVSYAFFLIHYPVITAAVQFFDIDPVPLPAAARILWSLAVLAVSLGCAWAMYAGVERPLMRRFANPRGPAGPRPGPVDEAAPAPVAGG